MKISQFKANFELESKAVILLFWNAIPGRYWAVECKILK